MLGYLFSAKNSLIREVNVKIKLTENRREFVRYASKIVQE